VAYAWTCVELRGAAGLCASRWIYVRSLFAGAELNAEGAAWAWELVALPFSSYLMLFRGDSKIMRGTIAQCPMAQEVFCVPVLDCGDNYTLCAYCVRTACTFVAGSCVVDR